jgi:hypothetical protein
MAVFFTLSGARIVPDASGKQIAKALSTTSSLQCPRHHRGPMVVVDDATYGYPGFRVSGCCQEFIDTIAEKLKNNQDVTIL